MKKILVSIIILVFLVAGCHEKGNNMPEEMPSDFAFLVQFGVQSKNEINTFDNIVVKDLIADGTATAEISFTEDEMKTIYQKMREINILESKELIPKNTNCMQTPHEEEKWEIKVNGDTLNLYWTSEYCELTDDAQQLMELRNYIFDIVKSKDEYKKLPEAKGGYL